MKRKGKRYRFKGGGVFPLSFCLSIFLVGCGGNFFSEDAKLERLFADDFEYSKRAHPQFATYAGDHRYDDKLGRVDLEAHKRWNLKTKQFMKRLKDIKRAELSEENKTNYDIYERWIRDSLADYKYKSYLMPVNHMWGFYSSFAELPKRVPLRDVGDYENYISRLNQFERYAEEHIELMVAGIEQGYVLPKLVMDGMDEAIRSHIVEREEYSVLYEPFEDFPKHFGEEDKERLRNEGCKAISNSVLPGYRRFAEFVENEYIPAGRDEISISAIPNGKAYYRHCVKSSTTLDISPAEIHKVGLGEVARIKERMREVIERICFEGDFKEFGDYLHRDESFYAESGEGLIKEAALIVKKVEGKLPEYFSRLPRTPFGIKAVPEYAAFERPAAYYQSPPVDLSKAGMYYINTSNLHSQPLYQLPALSVHETVPGHHLQIALQRELEGLPFFRRLGGFTAYAEGWALYAERLAKEMGVYEGNFEEFGRLIMEMWRACRLVVDTGIHYKGWSREKAIDYMAENTLQDREAVRKEIDRYIVWPGQAVAYKTGQLKLLELRQRAEDKLGEDFELRDFHNVILSGGSVPLEILEEKVRTWLRKEQ